MNHLNNYGNCKTCFDIKVTCGTAMVNTIIDAKGYTFKGSNSAVFLFIPFSTGVNS